MNIETGELRRIYENQVPEGFVPVPLELEEEALQTLEV